MSFIYSPLLPGAAENQSAVTTAGYIKVWNGSLWVYKPVKVWNGSQWVIKPVKFYNGASWQTTSGL